MYDMKALYEAYSVEEAVKIRLEHPEAQIIAGGTDVLVQMREGRRAGKELISIQKIDSMRGVSMDEEAVNLITYQQIYEANLKVISTGADIFDSVLEMCS